MMEKRAERGDQQALKAAGGDHRAAGRKERKLGFVSLRIK